MHSIITLHDNMHVLYHSLHKGSKGGDGGFAVDYKKERIWSRRLYRKVTSLPVAQYFRYCENAAKEMVSKNFLLDKVKGPAL